jgi:hypothetical protein
MADVDPVQTVDPDVVHLWQVLGEPPSESLSKLEVAHPVRQCRSRNLRCSARAS